MSHNRDWENGYNYAAGSLLRGEKTCDELLSEQSVYDRTEFDTGMSVAIMDWSRMEAKNGEKR